MSATAQNDIETAKRRGLGALYPGKVKINVGMSTCGRASGAEDVLDALRDEISARGLDISVGATGCLGICQEEPLVDVLNPGWPRLVFAEVDADRARKIVQALAEGEVIPDFALCKMDQEHNLIEDVFHRYDTNGLPSGIAEIQSYSEVPFFAKQQKRVLRNCGTIDPDNIEEYIAVGGYLGLAKAIQELPPWQIISEVTRSGLRGRGGAGFPTGKKWTFCRQAKGEPKTVICNADEGDPGAYMDRSILEGDPHSMIEGMIIGAFAIGAAHGVIYVRAEYPLAIEKLQTALEQAREFGFLGRGILGSDFDFDIEIECGSGAFVCGEETALMASIEGFTGEPRQRPPFPAQKGLWGKPTNINNVKTWASVPLIIGRGAEWYAEMGTATSKGTMIFSLVGQVKNTGLVEVPMGIKLSELVFDIGGGIVRDRKFKAVQTGGPSGGCIPANMADLRVEYEKLAEAGSIMGSGGLVVMDDNTCMVNVAKYFLAFTEDETCGKCTPCREGTRRMRQILTDITEGRGREGDIELLEEMGKLIVDTSLCGLGGTAPNPVLSTIRYFRDEYEAHIKYKRCPAGACSELVRAPCQSACPIDTEAWRYVAHLGHYELEDAYRVIRQENPFPSVCARVCDHKCEQRCRLGVTGERPVAIRALKRFVTDNTDPSVYQPPRADVEHDARIAIVGAGPAGLTAAHYLSLMGYRSTVFESEDRPGGMLLSCIPEYRLPHAVVGKEIDAILDHNVTLQCNTEMGRDITLDGLFDDGFSAVFLAVGAQASRRLKLKGEDDTGVYPAVEFLKAFNLEGRQLATGHVGVIGGGNSAIDAARTALRQDAVESVTVLYRRTREEMPAFEEEIEAAIAEGIELQPLVTPTVLRTDKGKLTGIACIRNRLGEMDASGRRRPVAMDGTDFSLSLETLIVAISEQPDVDSLSHGGAEHLSWSKWGTLEVDEETLACSRPGVFAGGDVVTGPNTVVDAIAAGKRVARMIDRYVRGEDLKQPEERRVPYVHVKPHDDSDGVPVASDRLEPPHTPLERRRKSFVEVERSFSKDEAMSEARRCLRCDLEFALSKQPVSTEVSQSSPVAQEGR